MRRQSRSPLLLVPAVVAGLLTAVTAGAPVASAAPGAAVAAAATPAAAATAAVPTTPGAFVGLTPARLLDTRTGVGAPKAPVAPGRPLAVTAAGRGGVPADAAAVVLSLTVVKTGSTGYLSAYPTGGTAPTASVMNWSTGDTLAGSATVTLGSGGAFTLAVQGGRAADLVADVAGYIVAGTPTAAGAYSARTPTRLLDTRTGNGATKARLTSGSTLRVPLAGRGGLPVAGGVAAVVATLTAVTPAGAGYLTVWPGGMQPRVSALNFSAGRTRANQVTVPLGTDGGIDLFAFGGPLDVVLDVTGYVLPGTATAPGTYVPVDPSRVLDTRQTGTTGPGQPLGVDFRGAGSLPAGGLAGVVANLTVTDTTSSGYLTAWPHGRDRPVASSLNWATGATVANQATLALGDGGGVDVVVVGATAATVVVDVSGYYLPVPPATPAGLTATTTPTTVTLHWSSPTDHFGFEIRRTTGSVAPTGPTDGTRVTGPLDSSYGVTDTGLAPATTYSYAVFAYDHTFVNYSAPATVTATTLPPDTTAPGPDTGLTVTVDTTLAILRWTPPTDADYRTSVVRRAVGTTPPTTPTDGIASGTGRTSAGVGQLDPATTYSFAVFARDGSGNVSPTPATATVTTVGVTGVSGTTTPLVPGGIDPNKGGLGTACPPTGDCVALSFYFDETRERHGLLMITVVRADGLQSYPIPLPSTVASFERPTARIACPAAGSCVLVGSYEDIDRATVSFTGTWDGTRGTTAVLTSATATAVPRAIACPTVGACVTVGTRTDAAGDHPWVARLSAGTWSDVAVEGDAGAAAGGLDHVACASITSCAAAGTDAVFDPAPAVVASTHTGTSWQVVAAPQPSGSIGWGQLSDVDCPEVGRCVVVGRYFTNPSPDTRYRAALLTWTGSTWTAEVLPTTSGTQQFDTVDVDCAVGRCTVLVGNDGPTATVLSRPVAGGAWTTASANALPGAARADLSTGLDGIACDATGRCAGAGTWDDAKGYARGMVAALSATQDTVVSVEPTRPAGVGGSSLGDPQCTDDGHCIATGEFLLSGEDSFIAAFTIAGAGSG